MTGEYRVQLESFEGPLDLLLHLARKAEVDIQDIPIATIADQFISHLEGIERIDIELAGEFLLMASTLMELKSRVLGNARDQSDAGAEPNEGEDEDPCAELIGQLLKYKRYRDAADNLRVRLESWEARYPAARAGAERLEAGVEYELEELDLVDLIEAFGHIMEAVNFETLGDHKVVDDDTPIELHAEDLLDLLKRETGPQRLRDILAGRTRVEMIGLFLAMLELVRQRRLAVAQSDGEVAISICSESEEGSEGG